MSLSKILPAAGRVYEYWHVVNKLFSGVPRSMMCTLPASAVSSMRMHGTKSAAVSISRTRFDIRFIIKTATLAPEYLVVEKILTLSFLKFHEQLRFIDKSCESIYKLFANIIKCSKYIHSV